ncbi:MAG: methylenetetrahydrofolate--tRNA-(uracil(54)-C(5))-methyltransferase (FADH(2)-oxidizing) TrmFO [Clostridiales bacterium]|nr:methylenetetrahydrofolate--tRNA-(uracil(54)-C(5))-methyltransferase (FADH(2)-oxidizing) TrmFO [Clostridiales bacterium]
MNDNCEVKVIGAGLAGCEAAYQLANRGIRVRLIDMKPAKLTPAHKSASFCELVCSNSLRSDNIENAVGLLKEELRRMGSLIMECADRTRVPAGGALAVDREGFSALVTEKIKSCDLISVESAEVTEVPEAPCIIATGPLTDGPLLESIERIAGTALHFHDAAAPIVTKESLDMDKVFVCSRYDRGSDYLNCPMNAEEYFRFIRELVKAETVELHDFETPRVFEGCMPVETMAKRGDMTLAYGPLKPVGLIDPRTGKQPFAVVQLRQDNEAGTLYNIVGFQTNLKFPEQRRVFGLIPGLEKAEYIRYGVMHRNSYMESPAKLTPWYELRSREYTFFAGQLTGVEGYIESASSGFVAGVNMARKLKGLDPVDFEASTAVGALGHYVSEYNGSDFQPMNVTFGIMEPLKDPPRNKRARYAEIAKSSLARVFELTEKGEI